MFAFSTWITVIFVVICSKTAITKRKVSVCYYRSWAQFYKGKAKFLPENIDPKLCSVISYASYRINYETYKLEGRQKNDAQMLKRLNALKVKNHSLKIFITVGGWSHEILPRFATMVKTTKRRKIFIDSVVKCLKQHRLDGINVDWEYPGIYTRSEPKKHPKDIKKHKKLLIHLLREMKKAFKIDAQQRRKVKPFQLTLAVPASRKKIIRGYDIKEIAKTVDWVNVMAYNLRGPWRKITGCPTLMKGKKPNIPDTIKAWMDGGMPPGKINLGLVSYGRTFKLKKSCTNNVGEPITGKGNAGISTKKKGILAYYEICSMAWKIKTSWKHSTCGAPYACNKENTWVSYDNPSSITNKVSTLVNKLNLNGISLWALDLDDFSGQNCNEGRYPLLKAAVDKMNGVQRRQPSGIPLFEVQIHIEVT